MRNTSDGAAVFTCFMLLPILFAAFGAFGRFWQGFAVAFIVDAILYDRGKRKEERP